VKLRYRLCEKGFVIYGLVMRVYLEERVVMRLEFCFVWMGRGNNSVGGWIICEDCEDRRSLLLEEREL